MCRLVSRLISAGVNVSLMDKSYLTALHYATAYGHSHVLQLVSNNSSSSSSSSSNSGSSVVVVLVNFYQMARGVENAGPELVSVAHWHSAR